MDKLDRAGYIVGAVGGVFSAAVGVALLVKKARSS